MIKLIEFLVKSIVKKPDQVKLETIPDQDAITIKISADEQDLGQLIGKGGRVIKALQSLAQIRASQEGKRCFLKIADSKERVASAI